MYNINNFFHKKFTYCEGECDFGAWREIAKIIASTIGRCNVDINKDVQLCYAEYSKLTFKVGIRIFPNFLVTSVEKQTLSYRLIIDHGIDQFLCFASGPQNRISRAGIKENIFVYD